jgi:hypothetical protein
MARSSSPVRDGRSAEARRDKDLCLSVADDFGGADGLSEVQRAFVRPPPLQLPRCCGSDRLRPILTYGPANMPISWRDGLNSIALPPIEDRMRA